jgi:hypothetical protein
LDQFAGQYLTVRLDDHHVPVDFNVRRRRRVAGTAKEFLKDEKSHAGGQQFSAATRETDEYHENA